MLTLKIAGPNFILCLHQFHLYINLDSQWAARCPQRVEPDIQPVQGPEGFPSDSQPLPRASPVLKRRRRHNHSKL